MTNYVSKFTFLFSNSYTSLLTVIEKYQTFVLRINEIRFPDIYSYEKITFLAWSMIMLKSALSPFTCINFELLANLNK